MKRVLLALALVLLTVSTALADAARPVTLRVKEQEPELFLVQWKVPTELPTGAAPSPVLPEASVRVGDVRRIERSGTWLLEQTVRCPGGISGEEIGIEYPYVNVTVSTIVRVELLSGARYAHVLAPQEGTWRVPEALTEDVPGWLREAQAGVLHGVTHAANVPGHLALLLALLLLGSAATAVRLVTAISIGHLTGVLVYAAFGLVISPVYAEVALLAAAAVVAREAMRPVAERGRLTALAAGAGLLHASALVPAATSTTASFGAAALGGALATLGFDATLLLAVAVLGVAVRAIAPRITSPTAAVPRRTRLLAYAVGGAAVALAVVAPLPVARDAAARVTSRMQLADLAVPGTGGSAASRRLAAQSPDAPLQSFLAIEAFETRHEVLLKVRDFSSILGVEPGGVLPVDAQEEAKRVLREIVTSHSSAALDGTAAEPVDVRSDFLTIDANGALPRPSPVPEPVASAWLGVTLVYPTTAAPASATVTWDVFEMVESLPATVTDPEFSRTEVLNTASPELRWVNELEEDPTPVVRATTVEPRVLWLPLPAVLLLLVGLALWRVTRSAGGTMHIAGGRVLLAGALLLGPVGGVTWALPASSQSVPELARARQILSSVLPNVYRSFQYPSEELAYDRLSLTVSGPVLRDVFLEHRRAVEMEERGGARVRIEAVEVTDVAETSAAGDAAPDGFVARATWTVGGTVTHFGHRHFRQNRYDARVTLAPVDGCWKIEGIEVLDETRLR